MAGKLPAVFEELEEAVVLFSEDGTPRDCNQATEALLGYSQTEMDQASLANLMAPRADRDQPQINEYITSITEDGSETFEWQIQRSNGEPRWIEMTISPITIDGTQYVLGEAQDLTAYKARGRRLQLLYRILRHNLRNEMNIIEGYAEKLANAIEEDNIQRQAEIIKETAEDIGKLSEAVEDLERLVEQDATDRRPMKTHEVAETVVAELQEEYPDATMQVTVEEETVVSADEGFRLALEHAIANAIEHNDAENPRVTITHDATDQEAVLRVADNGPGIPEMEIKALESGPTDLEHGSGLGLSIIQWCTDSLGGDINIETAADKGTTLTVQLPHLR